MKATVQLLRRYGRRYSRRDLGQAKSLIGMLTMHTVLHRTYGHVLVLQLNEITNQTDTGHLATLYEPVITGLGNGLMTFRGIERVETEDGVTGYAQEWRIRVELER